MNDTYLTPDQPAPPVGRTTVVNLKTSEYDVYIGRRNTQYDLPRSPWANPFKIGVNGNRQRVIDCYRAYLLRTPELLARVPELRGKRLGCWCHPKPCHGDVLAELANALDPAFGAAGPERAPMTPERLAGIRSWAELHRGERLNLPRAVSNGIILDMLALCDEVTRLRDALGYIARFETLNADAQLLVDTAHAVIKGEAVPE